MSRPSVVTKSVAAVLAVAVTIVGAGDRGAAAPGQELPPRSGTRPTGALVGATGGLRAAATADAPKPASSRLARTNPQLAARKDATRIPVMIKLDYDPTASYAGGVAGLAPTSPSVTGERLSGRSTAERQYEAYVVQREQAILSEVARRVPEATIGRRLRRVYGGVSAVVPANRIDDLLAIDGVAAVHENKLAKPLTDASPAFIGAPTVYSALGTTANAGRGVIYGNLDTGIWPEHPSFADLGNLGTPPATADGVARECNYGDNPLTPARDVFRCQRKLIGGAHFTDDYDVIEGDDPYEGTARDGDGHGTHTSSTSAGNIVPSAKVFGVERGPVQGLAPGAWVIEYKVCGPLGCFASDSAAAVERAILDGVDVINFSISGGVDPYTDPVELAFLDAYAAGVFVSTSAGNEGPGANTANHLSPWVTSTAASTQTREFRSTLRLTASNGDTFTAAGASITKGAGPKRVVLAGDIAGYNDPSCGKVPKAGAFANLIVACQRGTQARVWKGFTVAWGGGAGMILYNPALADVETDNHWVPTVHLADGTDLVAFLDGHGTVTGSFTAGAKAAGRGDVMAAFSSRGPAGLFVKPDITAPGVQILAGASPTPPTPNPVDGGSPPGELFQAIAGTSMSSPHIAGSAILMAALHPTWTPGQIRSALMTTAKTSVVKEDLTTPADPFDFGAGRVDLTKAGSATLTLDETPQRFFAQGGSAVDAIHLNIPSVNAPILPGRTTTSRTFTNVSNQRVKVVASGQVSGGTITLTPKTFTLDPGESAGVVIDIRAQGRKGAQQFGSVVLDVDRGPDLHLPVAFVRTQGSVSLVQSCRPASVRVGGLTTCDVTAQNGSFDATTVSLFSKVNSFLSINRTAGGAVKTGPRTAALQGVSLDGRRPGVPQLLADFPFDDYCVVYDYCPLDQIPGSLEIEVGDETLVNLEGFGTFTFAGELWDTIGITSNGYAVAGPATVEDVRFDPPDGPNPARPNNVIAPFWTDLDGSGTEGILANVLALGPSGPAWLVIEWRVAVFGTNPTVPANLRTMQVWLGLNGEEDTTLVYDPARLPADPRGQALLVGAENVLGEGQFIDEPPGADIFVASTPATPGDSVTARLFVRGEATGAGLVTTEMHSPDVPGVTIEGTPVEVRRA